MSVLRVAIGLAVVCTVFIAAAEEPTDDDAAFRAQLETLDARGSEIRDLSARFEQRKHTILLREPMVSRGRVRMLGEHMRWDTTHPAVSSMYMDDSALKIHYPDHNTLEIYELDAQLAQLAASPVPRLATLREHFVLTRDQSYEGLSRPHIALLLTPRSSAVAEHVQTVRVAVDAEHAWLLQMELTDVDGERTVIVLSGHQANTGISEDELQLVVPPGTREVRPLHTGGESPSPRDDE